MKGYLASGWFTDAQEKTRLMLREVLQELEISHYSPKDDGIYVPGKTPSNKIFAENVKQIETSDFVLASTEGKDMGTVFECGFAFSVRTPIIYYWDGEGAFNLMLAESGHYISTNREELVEYLKECKIRDRVRWVKFEGGIE